MLTLPPGSLLSNVALTVWIDHLTSPKDLPEMVIEQLGGLLTLKPCCLQQTLLVYP